MSKYKMVFFDLDGTLMGNDYVLRLETVDAIKEIGNLGLKISVATGRSVKSAAQYVEELGIENDIVYSNGGIIQHNNKFEVLHQIDFGLTKKLLKLNRSYSFSLKVHMPDGRIFKSDNTPWPDEDVYFDIGKAALNIEDHIDVEPVKIVFYSGLALFEDLNIFLSKFVDSHPQVRFVRTHHNHVELLNSKVNKAEGIRKVVEKYNFDMQEIIGVGDQENDYEMIRDSGLGVSVSPGTVANNKICNLKIPSPSENNIKHLFQYLKGIL